jgi:23S rRNA pseudouridine2605 synthase
MRINKYVASATGLSRRAADKAIAEGRVAINGKTASLGDAQAVSDKVTLDGSPITPAVKTVILVLNKPEDYVVSRNGQGSKTVYELLPEKYQTLQPVGRLDKNSSGLLLMTNDGELANQLTHPRYAKTKIYHVNLDKALAPLHQQMINDIGVQLNDGPSKLALQKLNENGDKWQVTMQEGRNRQIRRTFQALGYDVFRLHRTNFGSYSLGSLKPGETEEVN